MPALEIWRPYAALTRWPLYIGPYNPANGRAVKTKGPGGRNSADERTKSLFEVQRNNVYRCFTTLCAICCSNKGMGSQSPSPPARVMTAL